MSGANVESSSSRVGALQPLVVYVVFHPDSPEAPKLARTIFRWLRLHPDELGTGSMDGAATTPGLPVYYRAALSDAPTPTFTPAIDWPDARLNVVVPLVDDRLATDARWREALRALVELAEQQGPAARVLPVMLDRSFDQLAFLARPHNPIRVWDRADPETGEERTRARARRLRRRLTEELVRRVRQGHVAREPARLKVFVSHAKADGADVGERIRDGLAGVSQIEPWFDVNDLVAGHDATPRMGAAARASSGGFIAVTTDAYPTRPWCRHEATLARTPGPLWGRRRRAGASAGPPVYVVQPAVVVDIASDTWARPLAALAQVPRIGWPARPDPAIVDEGEGMRARERYARAAGARIADVVDRLLLESLLSAVAADRASSPAGGAAPPAGAPAVVHLAFTPDVWTLQRLAADRSLPAGPLELRYPGHALGTAERSELEAAVAACFPGGTRLVADEGFAVRSEASSPATPGRSLFVGVSIGGHDPELYAAGVSREHLNDLLVRVTRYVLMRGHRLAYGGKLKLEDSAALALLDAAERWRSDLAPGEVGLTERSAITASDRALATPPVVNFVSADRVEDVTPEIEARYLGSCEFRRLAFGGGRPLSRAERVPVALSEMRAAVAEETDVQLFVGGKLHGWSGLLPGLAEELLAALTAPERPPVLLVGGFGGCAEVLTGYLLGEDSELPEPLTFRGEKARRVAGWPADARLEARMEARYRELQAELERFRGEVRAAALGGEVRGIPYRTWVALCHARSPTRVLQLLLDALDHLSGAGRRVRGGRAARR